MFMCALFVQEASGSGYDDKEDSGPRKKKAKISDDDVESDD